MACPSHLLATGRLTLVAQALCPILSVFSNADSKVEADEDVGRGPGGPPHKTKWHWTLPDALQSSRQVTFSYSLHF